MRGHHPRGFIIADRRLFAECLAGMLSALGGAYVAVGHHSISPAVSFSSWHESEGEFRITDRIDITV